MYDKTISTEQLLEMVKKKNSRKMQDGAQELETRGEVKILPEFQERHGAYSNLNCNWENLNRNWEKQNRNLIFIIEIH